MASDAVSDPKPMDQNAVCMGKGKGVGYTVPPIIDCDFMCFTSRLHFHNPGLSIFNMIDRESLVICSHSCVKAATELLVRFFLARFLYVWTRSEVEVLFTCREEVTVTLVLKKVQAWRQDPLLERSPVDRDASMSTLGELRKSCNGGLACLEEVGGARVLGSRRLRGKFEVI